MGSVLYTYNRYMLHVTCSRNIGPWLCNLFSDLAAFGPYMYCHILGPIIIIPLYSPDAQFSKRLNNIFFRFVMSQWPTCMTLQVS